MGGGRDKWTDLHTNATNFRVLCTFIGNANKQTKKDKPMQANAKG